MIGLYGATCNNMYIFAKALAHAGVPVTFILDRKDNFPHSQPVWEDITLSFESGFDYKSIDWDEFEKTHDWVPPVWFFKPQKEIDDYKYIKKKSPRSFLIKQLAGRYFRKDIEATSVFKKMMECDCLIVCGVNPAILAMLTGKPYMIYPHGSDMRLAIGAEPLSGFKGKLIEWLTYFSFKKALSVASSLPDASAEVPTSSYKRLKNVHVEKVPVPYALTKRLNSNERRSRLQKIFKDLDVSLPIRKYYCFTPSRINFHWKGHDRILDAINDARESELDIHFIFLGWGSDYEEAIQYVKKYNLEKFVTILKVFCSKGFLYKLFESVDFIIDALNGSGSYGTGLSEAMSCGCPVVSWVSDMFDKPGWEAPPFIYARSKEEIQKVIVDISDGKVNLEEESQRITAWMKKNHDSEVVINSIKEKFKDYI